jgi:hypothetical protein
VLIETIPAALHEQRLDRVVALIADTSIGTKFKKDLSSFI